MINPTAIPTCLHEVLERREMRVKQQQELLKRYSCVLISFTVNMPGPIKMNEASRTVMDAGLDALKAACVFADWPILDCQKISENTGPEAIIAVDLKDPFLLKEAMISLEIHHPLGRLMDLDVIDTNGKIISPRGTKLPRRRCFLCEQEAVICARSQRHDMTSLVQKIEELTNDYKSIA